jgi:hypothetical protein
MIYDRSIILIYHNDHTSNSNINIINNNLASYVFFISGSYYDSTIIVLAMHTNDLILSSYDIGVYNDE